MGKASSNKKVARAAKAGGGRARAAGERNLLFPVSLFLVVILGTLLVVYARDNRSAEALEPPLLSDHWHSAYGIYVCDQFVPDLPEFIAPQNGGIHTHGDGLLHIHPFSSARAGVNANLGNYFQDAGEVLGNEGGLDDDELNVPGGQTYAEGDDSCKGLEGDPIVQVAVWDSYQAAADDEKPTILDKSLGLIRFESDGQAFTVAFAPKGADIPPPPSVEEVGGASPDLGVPEGQIPEDAEQPGTPGAAGTDTTGGSDGTQPTDATVPAGGSNETEDPQTPTSGADTGR